MLDNFPHFLYSIQEQVLAHGSQNISTILCSLSLLLSSTLISYPDYCKTPLLHVPLHAYSLLICSPLTKQNLLLKIQNVTPSMVPPCSSNIISTTCYILGGSASGHYIFTTTPGHQITLQPWLDPFHHLAFFSDILLEKSCH